MTQRRTSKGYRTGPLPQGFRVLPPVSKFFATLGKVYVRDEGSGVPPVYGIHVRPKHANRHGTSHGGFLATLADTFMAAFIHHQRPEVGKMWTTQLSMDYRRPAPMGAWLECHLIDLQRDGDTLTVQCELRIGALVTNRASATFKVAERRERR
ncbi:MAG: PaaI family thioesterase [Ferrovibrio sp.]